MAGSGALSARDAFSASARARKNRTPTSCDRCKIRKTKCVNPVPGPCEYCRHIGVACGVRNAPRQRPFYHVTEEEYRCSMQILQHFLPSRDLTLDNLRKIAKDLESEPARGEGPGKERGPPLDTGTESEEVRDLHSQLGCLMEDSLGEYRYVGACSEIAFNDAVCSMKSQPSPEKIIEPPRKCSFPPENPEKTRLFQQITHVEQPYLPPREYCAYYVARYFEEVHCTYWFFPAEQFHARLDETYADGGITSSSSWLCSLYSIFALGAASDNSNSALFGEIVSEESQQNPDTKTPRDYLMLAKALVPQIHEEADIDSIRGLAILSIALQTFGYRIMSYLYIGTSIRMGFSLGLQHDKSPASQSPVRRQQNRRIWWTLFILDQEIASRCGSPCVCDERVLKIETPMPSEQVLNPGTNTPLGILGISVSLCRLKKEIIQTIYPERASDTSTTSFTEVTKFITSLQSWQTAIPSHLKWGVPVAPTHRRAIAVLQLQYWNAMMLLTQPFLLYLVLHGKDLSQAKRNWFEKLGDICIDASQSAMVIFKTMAQDNALSSFVVFDSTCVLKVIMIMVLALVKTNSQEYKLDIELCLSLLQGMEQIGFCKTVVPELYARFNELGIMQDPRDCDMATGVRGHTVEARSWPLFDNDFARSFEDMQNLDTDFGNSFWMGMEMDFSQIPGVSESFQPDLGFLGESHSDG